MKKVYDLAKEIGITPLELVEVFKKYKIPVKNHMSDVSEEQEDELRMKIQEEAQNRERIIQAQLKAEEATKARTGNLGKTGECQDCKSDKIAVVGGKVSDRFNLSLKNLDYEGYVPAGLNIGVGDYMRFRYCIDCGQIQGKFPLDLKKIAQELSDDEE